MLREAMLLCIQEAQSDNKLYPLAYVENIRTTRLGVSLRPRATYYNGAPWKKYSYNMVIVNMCPMVHMHMQNYCKKRFGLIQKKRRRASRIAQYMRPCVVASVG
ncbi:hypothetical protein OCU04_011144 [Sclerotinia nivalis]|uniref:Uncharacterized protein n=1 Tax=Sclerotinia nivalis TaxID=352851 RepID=A0A9X0AC56_9HELO|nr:hypothetical protein OCU04_011144 [Sclerotinia nivalis]